MGPAHESASQMQNADQGEQTPGSIKVGLDLSSEPLLQQLGAFVVQAAPPHVQRLNLRGRRIADGLVVTLADEEVVLDNAPERRERQHDLAVWCIVCKANIEDKTVFLDREQQIVRTSPRSNWREAVGLKKVVDR